MKYSEINLARKAWFFIRKKKSYWMTTHRVETKEGTSHVLSKKRSKYDIRVLVTQSCLTLCDPIDQAPLSVGFSRQEYSRPRDQTQVSLIAGRFLTI